MSRSTQVAKNVMTGFFGQLITMILGFATRTVFIYTLSKSYLGVSGLFTSLLTVLNLSELGFGVSITYALYKPIAQNDRETIRSLMAFYRRAYQLVGLIVLLVGMGMMPFLDKLISGGTDLANVRVVFALYVLESVASYWLFAYKRTLLEANQQRYLVTIYNSFTATIIAVARIASLLILRGTPELSFYLYTAIGVAGQLLNNVLLGRRVDKSFSYLTEPNPKKLTREQREPIFKNIAGVFISKISGIMLTSIDNILISAFISIASVGVYSNYIMLKGYIIKPIGIVFESITASVGDFCATESLEKQEQFFKTIQFAYFWIYGFCSISLWILFNPFIGGIWIGKDYLMSDAAVFLVVMNFLLDGLAGAVIKFRVAHGLYWQAKFRYLFSALFNAVISYLLIKPLGIEGVLLGTTASILIMISFDPIIVFKNVFHKSALPYYGSYFGYLLLVLATGALVTLLASPFKALTIPNFLVKLCLCAIIPNGLWYLMFRRSSHMKYLKGYLLSVTLHFKLPRKKGNNA